MTCANLLVGTIFFSFFYKVVELIPIILGPILLGCDQSSSAEEIPDTEKLAQHGDEEQVRLDVNRAFVHYPDCERAANCIARNILLTLLL